MELKDLENKKKELEALLNQKVQTFQNLEVSRSNLASEIVELRGKVQMLEELISGEVKKEENAGEQGTK